MEKLEQSILMLEKNPYACVEVRIKPHNDIFRKLVIDNYIILYKVEKKHKKVIIYRVLYEKRDYLKIED